MSVDSGFQLSVQILLCHLLCETRGNLRVCPFPHVPLNNNCDYRVGLFELTHDRMLENLFRVV